MSRTSLLLVVLGAVAVARAAVAEPRTCESYGKLDFFPQGFENEPKSWTQANQFAAGNSDRYSLYPVVMYGSPWPKLHFLPIHPLLLAGGPPVPVECRAASTSFRRRALAEWGVVRKPAAFSWRTRLDGGADVPGFGSMSLDSMQDMPHWSKNIWNLKDGKHELKITVTIHAGSATIEDGPKGRAVPATDVEISSTVVFYKLTERPSLRIKSTTCGAEPGVTMHVSDMWPEPVPAPGGLGALFKPVFHVWGNFIEGIDGSPYSGEDGNSEGGVHFFDQYWIRQIGAPKQAEIPITGVREGWYNINVEGSLTSDMPSLLSLAGNGTFNANDTDPTWLYIQPGGSLETKGASLRGQPKFSGALVAGLNGTALAVQTGNTTLVSFEGPPQSIEVGQIATFTWQYLGLGNTTCKIDGRLQSNDPATGGCSSPLSYRVRDKARHTLELTLRDACGVARRETMDFSVTDGWSTTAKSDSMSGDLALPVPSGLGAPPARSTSAPTLLRTTTSGAAAAAARGGWAAAAAAAAGLAAAAAAAVL
ncbi:hypothetical protein Rsub_02716 [Raphidocelis subcapitata]|uniref:Uncharacterized protein n=1 Tax=Raphidocelis subcapitata TaxID=307507 RepID=A0A2V0NWR2_9CHLO|nr:hypothetical protein Rsub_02716 [Raphidocelis subcapitata]|eukprot:GBF90010.1 hypothetical protein Rsub_02716 [Raphidocelis subcapitata]